MKFKLLLLLLLVATGFLKAQQPYQNLIFTEVRMDQAHHAYVEICNMGDSAVNLAEFELGSLSPWDGPFVPGTESFVRLPSRWLNPKETFVIATVRDWVMEMEYINSERYGALTKPDTWRLADMQIHVSEAPSSDPTDSISVGSNALSCWGGYHCFYLRHKYSDVDSVVVDAVNGIFTGDNNRRPGTVASDVAGVTNATVNSILVRKASVRTGSGADLDSWDRVRGIDLTDSEWLPIPIMTAGGYEPGRKEYWTLGNHGDFRLNSQSLKSSTISIDWNSTTMTVPWGARNMDSIMNEFDNAPGIAWRYHFSKSKLDSTYTSVRTGDSLTLYACGNQLDKIVFKLVALPPSSSECRVIPKNAEDGTGGWYTPYVVTVGAPSIDSIREVGFDTRVDTLLKYLEKPEKATWEMIWVDGVVRPDLKMGDKLKVTAENGTSTKEYYIKIEKYLPSHNADLSSITWPDIPDHYKGIYGWMGDTIPNFVPTKYNYKVQIPYDVSGIPAFVVKPQNTDAKIQVERAATLGGSISDRTIKYTVIAEDDTTINTYSIELDKEKDLTNVQPYTPDPFFSQFVFRADWRQFFIEISNPGNEQLDLSRYCIVRSQATTIPEAFASFTAVGDWANRFNRYVPGFVWQDETNWGIQPAMLEQDFSVNSIVEPGDVFVMAWAYPVYKDASTRAFPGFDQIDVNFKNGYNPWGVEFTESDDKLSNYQTVTGGWFDNSWFLFKITNDSVINGLKPLIDIEDVEIIDVIGRLSGGGVNNIGTMYTKDVAGDVKNITFNQNSVLMRLPEIHKGNPIPGESLGDSATARLSEWFYANDAYWSAKGYGWPLNNSMSSDGIGSHELLTITEFISTVSSVHFVVSKGYSLAETIIGPTPGITADEFLLKIIKSDDAQVMSLTRGSAVLAGTDELVTGDVLTVVSADGTTTTKYTITVSAGVLDGNALLTSVSYTINVTGSTGTISGFAAGTSLRAVFEGVTAPATASLFTIYNADGSYASFKQINFDTVYVDVVASDRVFFEVTAQNGVTKIAYQLQPTSTASDAYVLSNVYDIDQSISLIKLVPDGINVTSFYSSLIPAPGATIELQNNMGQVRAVGSIYKDDKLIVTAQDGVTKKVYFLKMLSETAQERRAFIYSDVYVVNLSAMSVKLPFGAEVAVTDFANNIIVSIGATFVIQNADATEKTSGNMVAGDKIVVTSADGSVVNTYMLSFMVSSPIFKQGIIKMYPNPTSGNVQISGVQPGNNITIYNTAGRKVASFQATSVIETASLHQQTNGMYFIVVDNGSQVIGRFKLIKK